MSAPAKWQFEYIRDIHSQLRLDPGATIVAKLRGIITHRHPRGGVIFFGIQDITGSIQLLFDRSKFVDADWETIRTFKKSDFISVEGVVQTSPAGNRLTVVPSSVPGITADLGLSLSEADLPYRRVGGQIILSRLIRHLCRALEANSFIEIEPRQISVNWNGQGLEPLRVEYPGFGYNTYLAPTPVPQLLEAMIATAIPSLFCVGKCFSTSYRDSLSSTEASIIYAVKLLPLPGYDYWKFRELSL